MSDESQGAGWWQASDGKWYPPESAAQPSASVPPPVPGAAPGPGAAMPPAPGMSKTAKGCLIAMAVVAVLGVLVVGGAIFAIGMFADDVAENALGGGPCPFLSDDEASDALGDGTTAIEASGLTSVLTIIDPRVMPSDPSCALSREDDTGGLGRVARYEGSLASQKYDDELTKAKGITEDRGNGVSVTTDEYFNQVVDGFGDEAFCTKSSGLGAGVLVREGNTLVYVSVVADASTTPGLDLEDPDNPKLGTDDFHCELAQEIAADVLR